MPVDDETPFTPRFQYVQCTSQSGVSQSARRPSTPSRKNAPTVAEYVAVQPAMQPLAVAAVSMTLPSLPSGTLTTHVFDSGIRGYAVASIWSVTVTSGGSGGATAEA